MDCYDNDRDLCYCLEYNPQNGFDVDDIKQVLAVYEGENDGDNWHWVLELNDGRFVYLTGWDCQSDASHEVCLSAVAACHQNIIEQGANSFFTEDRKKIDMSTYLLNQLNEGKRETWREKMDYEND